MNNYKSKNSRIAFGYTPFGQSTLIKLNLKLDDKAYNELNADLSPSPLSEFCSSFNIYPTAKGLTRIDGIITEYCNVEQVRNIIEGIRIDVKMRKLQQRKTVLIQHIRNSDIDSQTLRNVEKLYAESLGQQMLDSPEDYGLV